MVAIDDVDSNSGSDQELPCYSYGCYEERLDNHNLIKQFLVICKQMIVEIKPQLSYLKTNFESIMKRYSDYFESIKQSVSNYETIVGNSTFRDVTFKNENDIKRWMSLVSELTTKQDFILSILNRSGRKARAELGKKINDCKKFVKQAQPIIDSEKMLTCPLEEYSKIFIDLLVLNAGISYWSVDHFFREKISSEIFADLANSSPKVLLADKFNGETELTYYQYIPKHFYQEWYHKWIDDVPVDYNLVTFELN
jgi:hypothetical protein